MAPAAAHEPARSRWRAEISTRHLSFIETGRSRPRATWCCTSPSGSTCHCASATCCCSRPAMRRCFRSVRSTIRRCSAARRAIDLVLQGHEPYPALAIDRHWTLVAANKAWRPCSRGVDASLLRAAGQRSAAQPASRGTGAAHRQPRRVARASARAARRQIEVSGDAGAGGAAAASSKPIRPPASTRRSRRRGGVIVSADAHGGRDGAAFCRTTTVFARRSMSRSRNWRSKGSFRLTRPPRTRCGALVYHSATARQQPHQGDSCDPNPHGDIC